MWPCLCRWLKLFQPLAYFFVGITFGYLSAAFYRVCRPDSDNNRLLNEQDLIGVGAEDTYMVKRQKRFRRSWEWFSVAATPSLTAVGCTLLCPLVQFMGDFFRKARFSNAGQHGLLEFCRKYRSPARAICHKFIEMLGQPNNDFWTAARGPTRVWSTERLAISATEAMRVVAGMFYRLIHHFSLYPQKLGQLFDPDLSDADRTALVREFVHCKTGCYEGGFAGPVRSVCGDNGEFLLGTDLTTSIEHSLRQCPAHNIQNEDRFARAKSHHISVSRGRPPDSYTVCAAHVNSEAQAWHSIAMDRYHKALGSAEAARQPTPAKSFASGWHAYVSRHSKDHSGDLRAVAAEWEGLFEADRRGYARAAAESREPLAEGEVPPAAAPPPDPGLATPYGIGDGSFPLNESHVKAATTNLQASQAAWRSLIGTLVSPRAGNPSFDCRTTQRCDTYGPGVCKDDLSEDQHGRFKTHKTSCWALSKVVAATVLVDVPLINLFTIQEQRGAAGSDAPAPEQRLYLLPFSLMSPSAEQVFWRCELDPGSSMDVGGVVRIPLSLEALSTSVSVATWMLNLAESCKYFHLTYTFEAMDRLRIATRVEITDFVRRLREGSALDAEMKLLRQIGKGRKQRSAAKRSGQRRRPGAASSSGSGPAAGGGARPRKVLPT